MSSDDGTDSIKRLLPLGDLDPQELFFAGYTLLESDAEKQLIEDHCLSFSYLALIDYDDQLKGWVWHTLFDMRSKEVWKKGIADRFKSSHADFKRFQEKWLVDRVVAALAKRGIAVDTEVKCAAGVADIVTKQRDAVFEIKLSLTRENLFRAVSQVLLYREAINPEAKAFIVGTPTNAVYVLYPYIRPLGIEIVLWDETKSNW